MISKPSRRAVEIFLPAVVWLAVAPAAGGQLDTRGTELPAVRSDLAPVQLPSITELDPEGRDQIARAEGWVQELRGDHPDLAEAYGSLGRVYLAYSFDSAAATAFSNAAGVAPDDSRWQYYLGYSALRTGSLATASAALERALESKPGDIPTMVRLGDALRRARRWEEARRILENALRLEPGHAYARFLLGSLDLEQQRWRSAIDHLEAALRLQPAATSLYHPLALAYRELGNRSRAEELLRQRGAGKVAMVDPLLEDARKLATGVQLLLHKGSVAMLQGRVGVALAAYEQALAADPANVVASYNVGTLLLQVGQTERGMDRLRATLRLDPEYLKAHLGLGTALSRQGSYEEALGHLQKALELDPENSVCRQNLANALLRAGQCEAALEHYRWLVRESPVSEAGRLGAAHCLTARGSHSDALAEIRQGLELKPESRGLREALVRLLAASPDGTVRDGERAVSVGEQLFRQTPGISTAEALAMAYAEAGRFDEAAAIQRMALDGARRGGLDRSLPRLEAQLRGYQNAEPWRDPWP